MAEEKPRTPISDEEAEEMVRRFTDSPESAGMVSTPDEWQEYVASKMLSEAGYETTVAQIGVFERGRELSKEKLGYGTSFPYVDRPAQVVYRDLTTGRFMSVTGATERYMNWLKFKRL